jgi:Secretion system C-terminal sorting domain
MKHFYLKFICIIFTFSVGINLFGQDEASRQWMATENGNTSSEEDSRLVIATSLGNIYVVGSSNNGSFIYVSKYSSTGVIQSSFNYSRVGYKFILPRSLQLDASDNLIVSGVVSNTASLSFSFLGANYKAFTVKFNTASGANTAAYELDYSPNNSTSPLAVISTKISFGSLYVAGFYNDSIWVGKININTGVLAYAKTYKKYSQTTTSSNYTFSKFRIYDFTIDNNKNIYLVGQVKSSAAPIAGGPAVVKIDGCVIKVDSNLNSLPFGSLLPDIYLVDGTAADSPTSSVDLVRKVVVDNSNNIYFAAEMNDSATFNKIKVFRITASGSSAGWTVGGTLVLNPLGFTSFYKSTGEVKGLIKSGSNIYVNFVKPYFHKSLAQQNDLSIAEAVGMMQINANNGNPGNQIVEPTYTTTGGAPFYFTAKNYNLSAPLYNQLSTNVFMVYSSFRTTISGFFSIKDEYSINIVKYTSAFTVGTKTKQTLKNPNDSTQVYVNNDGIIDNNDNPVIVGKGFFNAPRGEDGLLLMNNPIQPYFFNQVLKGVNEGKKMLFVGNNPVVIGQKNDISTRKDLYFAKYNPANGTPTSVVMDGYLNNDNYVDATNSSLNVYSLASDAAYNTSYYMFRTDMTASNTNLGTISSSNIKFNPKFIKYHIASSSGNLYVAGNGFGGDLSIAKYSTIGTLLDTVPQYTSGAFSSANRARLDQIIYDGGFAYGVYQHSNNGTYEPVLEKIRLDSMEYSTWDATMTYMSNLAYTYFYDLQLDSSKNRLIYLASGYDASFDEKRLIACKDKSNLANIWKEDILPAFGTSFVGNSYLFFDKVTDNPYSVTLLSNNNIYLEEYALSTGGVISSDSYPIISTVSNEITDVKFDRSRGILFVAVVGKNKSNGLFSSKVYAINTQSKQIVWIYNKNEADAIIYSINIAPNASGRIYITGSQKTVAGAIGTDLFTEKLCDFARPVLSTNSNLTICANAITPISTINYSSNLLWSNGATTTSIVPANVPGPTNYYTTYTNPIDGCFKNSDTIAVQIKGPINKEICFTSFDKNQNKILVYFDAFASAGADSVIIYRDFGANNFQRVGAVTADSTWWQDNTLGTTISQALAYKIQIKDTCGQVGALSFYHKPVFVTSFPNVIAGANTMNFEIYQRQSFPGLPNKYFNLMGQNITTGLWDSVATIAAPTSPAQTSFQIVFTPSAQQLTTYGSDYRIDAKLDTAAFKCTISNYAAKGVQQAKATQGGPSHSNLRTAGSGLLNVLFNASILTYPNPSSDGVFNISSSTNEVLTYDVTNTSGKILSKGQFSKFTTLDLQTLSSGVYVLTISDGKNKIRQQLIK